jgi:hypothetical protein
VLRSGQRCQQEAYGDASSGDTRASRQAITATRTFPDPGSDLGGRSGRGGFLVGGTVVPRAALYPLRRRGHSHRRPRGRLGAGHGSSTQPDDRQLVSGPSTAGEVAGEMSGGRGSASVGRLLGEGGFHILRKAFVE